MGLAHSPSIVTNGLVFAYDMANTQKSFKGAPTTNLITSPNPTTVGGAWGVTGLSAVTANAAIAPDGTLTATKLVASTSNNTFQFVGPASSSQPTGTITYSCHMKAGEYTTGSLFLTQSGNNGAVFNLTNGTVVSVTGTGNTAAITPHPNGNGWWRCSVTNTGGTVAAGYRVGPLNGCLANVGGDGVSGIYVWNCQAEQQSFATPFINGTRSNTQAILDQTNNNTVTASSLTYAANNTFSFNGSANRLDCGTGGALTLGNNGPFTASAWVKVSTLKNYSGIISKVQSDRGGVYSFMCVVHNDGTIGFYNNAGWYWSSNAGITTNTWYNVVFSFNGSVMSYYVNGVAYGTSTLTWPETTSHKVFVGSWYSPNTIYDFNGTIAIAQLYNRALSAAEVQQNFNALRGRYGI